MRMPVASVECASQKRPRTSASRAPLRPSRSRPARSRLGSARARACSAAPACPREHRGPVGLDEDQVHVLAAELGEVGRQLAQAALGLGHDLRVLALLAVDVVEKVRFVLQPRHDAGGQWPVEVLVVAVIVSRTGRDREQHGDRAGRDVDVAALSKVALEVKQAVVAPKTPRREAPTERRASTIGTTRTAARSG